MELKHFTDKKAGGLLAQYERLFANLTDKPIKYLEVGILKGGSIEWAKQFFKNGLIFGIDKTISSEAEDLTDKNTHFVELNQDDTVGLKEFGEKFGEFDLIVDDGSHIRELTANTFNVLLKYVKSGGWYVIEDWSAGYAHSPEHRQYAGMVELITEIMLNREKYGIGNIVIIYEKKSFAAFKKL